MIIHNHTKDPAKDSIGLSTYERPSDAHRLMVMTRVVGVCTAIVVCGVGVDVAYHRHVMGFYVTAASGVIFFLEVTWVITLFVQLCIRDEDSLCTRCWLGVLTKTRGWRKALFYLPLSCILAWKPNKLWLSYVAAGLLVILSLLYIAWSALERGPCQPNAGIDSVGESLLNSRQENYDRFEDVLDQDAISETAMERYDTSDGPPGLVKPTRIANLNKGLAKLPHCLSPCRWA